MDIVIDLIVELWRIDPGFAVLLILAAGGFVSTTVLLVTKVVRGAIGATRQVHTWMRESGRLTRPDAPSPDLGQESPALVNLLFTRGRLSRDAVRATLLDLAARGAVGLYQPDHDPAGTMVIAVHANPPGLTPYEQRVMAELASAGTGIRLAALPALQPRGMRRWHRQFRNEVQAEARDRGLTYLDTSIISRSIAAAFVPCSVGGFVIGIGGVMVIVFIVATLVVGERSRVWLSPQGREVLARWLGVRSWLEAHEVFADLPPAAVTVWGRYLSFGAALGVLRPAAPPRT